jgi:leukotriene B4 12-hydroxydehydrogenase/15-oxo-prostaglandin 13-reductase
MPVTNTTVPSQNRQFMLAARPKGMPQESDFKLNEGPMPALSDGQVLLRTLYLSVDPYMRGRISGVKSYAEPVLVGNLMEGGGVGQVVRSNNAQFKPGDFVEGFWGWQEWAASDGKMLRKLDPALAPLSTALGVLGMPGMTAYFGLLEICKPQPGETVVVSGAAGAVGSLVGQIARIAGCRTIGVAGSEAKVRFLTEELGFDAALNYKTVPDYKSALHTFRELCPDGVDCYFDNVGGTITDAVFGNLKVKARIAVCGQISQYNLDQPEPGPRLLQYLLVKQARAEGFLVFQFIERYREGIAQMARWLHEGKIKYREHITEGFENTPRAFIGMLKGENTGKTLVHVADPSLG